MLTLPPNEEGSCGELEDNIFFDGKFTFLKWNEGGRFYMHLGVILRMKEFGNVMH